MDPHSSLEAKVEDSPEVEEAHNDGSSQPTNSTVSEPNPHQRNTSPAQAAPIHSSPPHQRPHRPSNPPTTLPSSPPSLHITHPPPFSIFTAILAHPELTLEVAKNLSVVDLISLYAISKDFHMLVNARFTALINAQWRNKCHESGSIFIFRCYRNLCQRDPARRMNENAPGQLRWIPTFRWLKMVMWREWCVDQIFICLAKEGHRMPRQVTRTIKKIWFTMDVSDNARRIGLMQNERFWTNQDLWLATMFFLKLDMRLTHPATGNGETGLRNLLLGQRSLSTLARVLRRDEMRTQLDMLRMMVRFKYSRTEYLEQPILGVPPREVGLLEYEGWGVSPRKFIQIDELVMRECVMRGLNLQPDYVSMMLYGYIDKTTWQDVRTPMPTEEDEGSEESDEGDEDIPDVERELEKTSLSVEDEERGRLPKELGQKEGEETHVDQ